MIWVLLLLFSLLPCSAQQNSFADLAFMEPPLGAAAPIGTNGVLWWTNNVDVGSAIVDPADVDLSAEQVYAIAARNCTNLQSLVGPLTPVTNFTFNGLGSLTNFQLVLNAGSNVTDSVFKLLKDNGGSNANCTVSDAPSSTGVTNLVILRDRGYNAGFANIDGLLYFGPINTTYTVNGSSMFVGDLFDMAQADVYSIVKGTDIHNFCGDFNNTTVTNADFNGDNFDQNVVDSTLSGISQNGQSNGFLDLQNTTAPTDGYSNGDYQTLTNAGWTVLLTP